MKEKRARGEVHKNKETRRELRTMEREEEKQGKGMTYGGWRKLHRQRCSASSWEDRFVLFCFVFFQDLI